MLKISLFIVFWFFVLIISYKSYRLSKALKIKNKEMKKYTGQMEKIIAGSANLVFVTWKDQKECILFTENPAYKSKNVSDLTKVQQIQHEINVFQEELNAKNKDIKKLMEKERLYLDEIQSLKIDYQMNKKKVLDEGASLGFTSPVLREFR